MNLLKKCGLSSKNQEIISILNALEFLFLKTNRLYLATIMCDVSLINIFVRLFML